MRITINLQMPEKDQYTPEACAPLSPEEQVRDALDEILSGRNSKREWSFIQRTYKHLKQKHNPSSREKELISMIDPVLRKFGYYGVVN